MNMPRNARKKSVSNIYHVMVRGINKQDIFEEEDSTDPIASAVYTRNQTLQDKYHCTIAEEG